MTKMAKKENKENRALAIFIKNPELGKAKTRIAKDSNDEKALSVYKSLLSITRNLAVSLNTNTYVFYSQFIDPKDEWISPPFHKKLQGGKDLGEKMSNGFRLLFTERYKKVLLIGSDCPYITEEIIEQAYQELDEKDFVFGPTFDGGYYLIGMKQFRPLVFADILWSTESVMQTSIERVFAMGCSIALLPKLQDIDHLSDWVEYKGKFN